VSDDCFLSYSSKDLRLAESIHARLTEAGLDVWFDKIRLRSGFDWHREIEAGCESSRVVLPLLTPNWKESEWTRYETYGAENVIPLLAHARGHAAEGPPYTLQRILYFETLFALLDGRPPDECLRSMAAELARPEGFQEWDLEKMLEHLHAHLSPENNALLTALSHVINDRKAVPETRSLARMAASRAVARTAVRGACRSRSHPLPNSLGSQRPPSPHVRQAVDLPPHESIPVLR
jgi:hypothetical protein